MMPYIQCPACKETTIGSGGEDCRTCDGTGEIWVKKHEAEITETINRIERLIQLQEPIQLHNITDAITTLFRKRDEE